MKGLNEDFYTPRQRPGINSSFPSNNMFSPTNNNNFNLSNLFSLYVTNLSDNCLRSDVSRVFANYQVESIRLLANKA